MEVVLLLAVIAGIGAVAYLVHRQLGNVHKENGDFRDAVGVEPAPRADWRSWRSWRALRDAFGRDRHESVVAEYRGRRVQHRWDLVSNQNSYSWESSLQIELSGDLPSGFWAGYPPRDPIRVGIVETFELDASGAAGPIDDIKWDARVQARADDLDELSRYMAGRDSHLATAIVQAVRAGTRTWTVEDGWLGTTRCKKPSEVLDALVDIAGALDAKR